MKRYRIFLTVAAMLFCVTAFAQRTSLKYVDATTLTIINKAEQTPVVWHRVDTALYKFNPTVYRYYRYSTGMAVVFRSDSRRIAARWTTTDRNYGANMTAISQKGMDLYVREPDGWLYAGFARPSMSNLASHSAVIVDNMEQATREYLLYLPLFDEVLSLEIGVDEGAFVEPADNPFRHRVVVMGSSITHGTGSSRPGIAYPAQMERHTGVQFINLGTSGQSKMQPEMGEVIADTHADAFVFDVFSNPSAREIHERFVPFVQTIRKAHPTTPLIFLQTLVRETGNYDTVLCKVEADKRQAAVEELKVAMKSDRNIYFIDPGLTLGTSHDASGDGVHPSDLGYSLTVDNIQPKIMKILSKYGIK